MSFNEFKALIGATFRDPQGVARHLMAQNWPVSARWMGCVLAATLSTILLYVGRMILISVLVPEGQPTVEPLQPLVTFPAQFGALVVTAFLMAGVGRMFGGKGSYDDALLLVVWSEIPLLMLQALQLAVALVSPMVAEYLGYAVVFFSLWLLVNLVMALHGFTSAAKVVLGILGTVFAVALLLTPIAMMLGLLPEMPQ